MYIYIYIYIYILHACSADVFPNHTHQTDAQSQSRSISLFKILFCPFTTFLFHPLFNTFPNWATVFFKALQYDISQPHQFTLGRIAATPKGKYVLAAHADEHNPMAPLLLVQLGLLHAQGHKEMPQHTSYA